MQKLLSLIEELGDLRTGCAQFLFYSPVVPPAMIEVRKQIIKFKETNPTIEEIDFIIQSPGGSADDAYRIIRTLRNNFKIVNIVIPFWAKSAATLLAFGGSKIIMDEFGEFGPLDVQLPKEEDDPNTEIESALIDEVSLERIEIRSQVLFEKMFNSIRKSPTIHLNRNELASILTDYLTKLYMPLLKQINPYRIGEKKRKLDIGAKYAERILVQYNQLTDRVRKVFIDYLVNECPHHGYIVDTNLIKLFLPNIVASEEIGKDYASKLSEVSLYFMEVDSQEEYIGFVIKAKPKDADVENAEKKVSSPPEKIKPIRVKKLDSKTIVTPSNLANANGNPSK